MRVLWFVLAAMWVSGAAVASPPPAPPSFIVELAKRLVPTQTIASWAQYADAFADDLTVSVDGKQVASDKAAWLAAEKHRLGKVDRRVLGFVEGYDSILVIDRYDDRSDLPASPNMFFDPRYKTRASQFVIGPDQRVHVIRIVQTDGVIQTAP